jgi:hypothetical protein
MDLDLSKRTFLRATGLLIAETILQRRLAGQSLPRPRLEIKKGELLLRHGATTLAVSLKCPRFVFEGQTVGEDQLPLDVKGDVASGKPVEVSYSPMSLREGGTLTVRLFVQWSPGESVLRKWASYRIDGTESSPLLKEVIMEQIDTGQAAATLAPEQPVFTEPMSYPVFLRGFFVGIEFPVASTRVESNSIILAHRPGKRLRPGATYETHKAVYGTTARGKEKRRFQDYIIAKSPGRDRRFFVWEPWIALPIPYKEEDHLELLRQIDENLYQKSGGSIDSCLMTAGWSNPQTLWEIDDRRFPQGFSRIREATEQMQCRMGLWISPSSFYAFAQDANWAHEQGYETAIPRKVQDGAVFQQPAEGRVACLGGQRYYAAFKQRVVDLFTRYNIGYAYFDGYQFECAEADHGHEPGPLSVEGIADHLIDIFQAIRKAKPDAWLEGTCFGGNASPWWLLYLDTVYGYAGDDCPWGRVPAPIYRETYTTARDYYNLQGIRYSLLPASRQEVFAGLDNHTTEPVVNDAVMGLMRGNMLYMLETDPRVMSEYGWRALARILKWSRQHVSDFRQTQALLPASWSNGRCPKFSHEAPAPREPYGYAHWEGRRGFVILRNPWILPQSYSVKLDAETELSPQAAQLSAVSLYPENRLYATGLKFGDQLTIPLAPYETLVLEIAPNQPTGSLPRATRSTGNWLESKDVRRDVKRIEFTGSGETLGPDWFNPVGNVKSALQFRLEATVSVKAPQAELLVLSEEKSPPINPICRVVVDGTEVPALLSGPDLGYAGTFLHRPEQWLFLRFPLTSGENRVQLEMLTRSELPTVSVWAWATKPGTLDASKYPNSLPQPEEISLDTIQILSPVTLSDTALPVVKMEHPKERIEGIYLDAIELASTIGSVAINKSPSQSALRVRGKTFLRGIAVVAPSRIAYRLDGKYRRFQALVGVDGATAHNDKSTLAFEVWVDGQKRWASARVTRWDNPQAVDVDIQNGNALELRVTDYAREGTLDRSGRGDWAEARLLA